MAVRSVEFHPDLTNHDAQAAFLSEGHTFTIFRATYVARGSALAEGGKAQLLTDQGEYKISLTEARRISEARRALSEIDKGHTH